MGTPDLVPTDGSPLAVGVLTALGRSPFPSIRGPFPVYKERPFYDARRIEGE